MPRTEFVHRGNIFSDHGDDCGCTICGYRLIDAKEPKWMGSVSLVAGDACWFQGFFDGGYPKTREEAADVILDKHMKDRPNPVSTYAFIPPNPKRKHASANRIS